MSGTKTILITGAGSGFGRESSLLLAKKGHKVIASVQTIHEIESLRQEAKSKHLNLQVEKLDITNEADRLRASEWDLDVLVNNAGISHGGAVVDIPEAQLRQQFEVNVFGTVLLTQKIARKFVSKRKGKIVFISSVAGLTTDPFAGAYSASKHALEAFSEALNAELHEFGVQVQTVNPGPILTGFNDRMFEEPSYWYPEDRKDAIFDYTKLAFPHEQYDPHQVSQLIAEVVDSGKRYRNCAPPEIEEGTKKQMQEVWDRQVHDGAKREELVQTAYDLKPGTSNGK